jgi:hypothetical protein
MNFNFYGFDDQFPITSPKMPDDDSPQLIETVKVGRELMKKINCEEILLDKQLVKKMNSEGEEEEWYQLSKDYRLSLGKSLTGILEGEYSKAIHELRSDSANQSESDNSNVSEKSQVDIPNNRQVLIQLLSHIEDEKITYFDVD